MAPRPRRTCSTSWPVPSLKHDADERTNERTNNRTFSPPVFGRDQMFLFDRFFDDRRRRRRRRLKSEAERSTSVGNDLPRATANVFSANRHARAIRTDPNVETFVDGTKANRTSADPQETTKRHGVRPRRADSRTRVSSRVQFEFE